jgi:predicted  nucleic acid-binding Zn-ribbon protein
MLLLEIQDLHLQRASLLEEPGGDTLESDHFNIDPDQAVHALDSKIEELKGRLEPWIRTRCDRGLPAMGRMLVPVIGGICYGCFESIPTSTTREANQEVGICESCGRFIYLLS